MRLPRRHLAGMILLVAALLLAVALTACGSPASGDGIATANSGAATPSASAGSNQSALSDAQKARKFAQCMRDHGIDVTADVGSNGESRISIRGGQKAKVDAAMKACAQYAPGSGGENRKADPETLERARKFAKCMRDHGVTDFPDPDPNGGIRVQGRRGSDLDPDSRTFQKAQHACASIMGDGKLGTGGGPGGTAKDGSASGGDA